MRALISNSFIFIQAADPAVSVDEESGIVRLYPTAGDEQITIAMTTMEAAVLIGRLAKALRPSDPSTVVEMIPRARADD